MDLSANAAARRNSFTSQQNIAHDIIADIYVTGDGPDEFATFTTDISLIKGGLITTTSATDLHMAVGDSNGCGGDVGSGFDKRHANNSKRSYSVDTIKFQFPQMQQLQPATTAIPSSTLSLATTAARKQELRQRSQSAQYNIHTSLVKSPSSLSDSRQSFKSEENLKEDLNEEEFIDSLIAEYTFSQDDYNNNNNSNNNFNNDYDDDYDDFNDDYAAEDEDEDNNDDNGDGKNIELPDADDDDGDLTQVSSFDDDCYIFDAADSSMRKE